jgi:hypothetical protein
MEHILENRHVRCLFLVVSFEEAWSVGVALVKALYSCSIYRCASMLSSKLRILSTR